MCMVWHCHDEKSFYWSILSAFLEAIALIALTESHWQSQSFFLTATAHSERFPFNPTRHTASLFLASIRILQSFVVPHLASITIFFETLLSSVIQFSSINLFRNVINLFRNGSILFHFSSDLQMEIRSIKFLISNHVEPKHRISLCSKCPKILCSMFSFLAMSSRNVSQQVYCTEYPLNKVGLGAWKKSRKTKISFCSFCNS